MADSYYATLEYNGCSPGQAMKNSDGAFVNGRLAVRVVESPDGSVIFYAVPPPHKYVPPYDMPFEPGEEMPMIKETVDVVSSRAVKLEEENAGLRAQLTAKEERIDVLIQQNTDLQNFLMEITRTALGRGHDVTRSTARVSVGPGKEAEEDGG
jgi:hypothetical protein